jgi:hypothetical protein
LCSLPKFVQQLNCCIKIYIENLHDTIDNAKLSGVFSSYGGVKSAEIVRDAFTDASRSFEYVETGRHGCHKSLSI